MGGVDLNLPLRQAHISEGFEDIGEYHHVGCNDIYIEISNKDETIMLVYNETQLICRKEK